MDDFLEQVARRRHQGVFTLMYVLMWVVIVISGFSALMYLMSIMGVDAEGNFRFNFIALIFAVVFGGIAFLLWRRADSVSYTHLDVYKRQVARFFRTLPETVRQDVRGPPSVGACLLYTSRCV